MGLLDLHFPRGSRTLSQEGGHLRYDNFRRRVWAPALKAAGSIDSRRWFAHQEIKWAVLGSNQ